MEASQQCDVCGADLGAEVVHGLCPVCLLREAVRSLHPTDAEDRSGPTISYLGDYVLLEEIAHGAMGVVYKAVQTTLKRVVAVKILLRGRLSSEDEIKRFKSEAAAAASLQHPNIVAIYEVGEQQGLWYFSMEYIEGKSLAEISADKPLDEQRAARYVKTIAETIHYAHERGVLHRDLKPANVLIDLADQPRITDFGLAKRVDSGSGVTLTGAVLGTPSYMSPEQAQGTKTLSLASDIYSIGAILYQLLTAHPPFQGDSPVQTLMLLQNSEPQRPRWINTNITRDLETICLKCLEKNPARRYESAKRLAEDLTRFLNNEPVTARPIRRSVRAWRWCQRNPWQTAAAVSIALVVAVVTAVFVGTQISLRERLWRSLLDQTRAANLAGQRVKAIELAAEAARIKINPDLRSEAIRAAISPGGALLFQIQMDSEHKAFSSDGSFLALHARYPDKLSPNVAVWDINAKRELGRTWSYWSVKSFSFVPGTPNLFISRTKPHSVNVPFPKNALAPDLLLETDLVLWDPVSNREIQTQKLGSVFPNGWNSAPLFFGGVDGPEAMPAYSAILHQSGDHWYQIEGSSYGHGDPICLLSPNELLVHRGHRLYRVNTSDSKSLPASPIGMSLVKTSANGGLAVLRTNKQRGVLVVWDVLAGKKLGEIPNPDRDSVHISPNGRMIALQEGSELNALGLWEIGPWGLTRRLLTLAPADCILPYDLVFSPDGSLIAVPVTESRAPGVIEGSSAGLRICDTVTCETLAILPRNYEPVWSDDGRLLATSGPDPRNPEDGAPSSMFALEPHRWVVNVSARENVHVNVWQISPQVPTYRIPETVTSLIASFDGKSLASNEYLWNVDRSEANIRLTLHDKAPGDRVVFEPNGTTWALDTAGLRLSQFIPKKRQIVINRQVHPGILRKGDTVVAIPVVGSYSPASVSMILAISFVDWRHVDNTAYFIHQGGVIEQWELRPRPTEQSDLVTLKRNVLWTGLNPTINFTTIATGDNGRLVAAANLKETGSAVFQIGVWDVTSHRQVARFKHDSRVRTLIFSADCRLVFASHNDRANMLQSISINEIRTSREVARYYWNGPPADSLAASPTGDILASGHQDGTVSLWDISAHRLIAAWPVGDQSISALTFTPDGRVLISAAGGTIKLWDLASIRRELAAIGLDW